MKKNFFPSLIAFALLAMIHRVFAKPASAKPVINAALYDAINACIEEQMSRLSIPGASLAGAIKPAE